MFLLYRLITWLALAGAPLYALAVLARRPGRGQEICDRLGFLPRDLVRNSAGAIWLQAASVGELRVARSLARELQHLYPDRPLLLSVTTPAARRLLGEAPHDAIRGFTFPLDLPPVVRRVVAALRPCLFIAIETEIWPNLYAHLRRAGVPVVVVNGRISDRALPQYLRWAGLFRPALAAVRLVCARSPENAARFISLGVAPERVKITGNLKFDCPVPQVDQISPPLRAALHGRRVLVAGSTHAGEEETALAAARRALENGGAPIAVVLAPRHAARLEEVAGLLDREGVTWTRRSALDSDPPQDAGNTPLLVILLDTHGELASLYAVADVALLGGTLVPVGGHNPLEAAAGSVPTVSGPHLHNLRDTAAVLQASGALVPAADPEEAAALLARLLANPGESSRRGEAARCALEQHAGATARTAGLLGSLLRPLHP